MRSPKGVKKRPMSGSSKTSVPSPKERRITNPYVGKGLTGRLGATAATGIARKGQMRIGFSIVGVVEQRREKSLWLLLANMTDFPHVEYQSFMACHEPKMGSTGLEKVGMKPLQYLVRNRQCPIG